MPHAPGQCPGGVGIARDFQSPGEGLARNPQALSGALNKLPAKPSTSLRRGFRERVARSLHGSALRVHVLPAAAFLELDRDVADREAGRHPGAQRPQHHAVLREGAAHGTVLGALRARVTTGFPISHVTVQLEERCCGEHMHA